MFRDKNFDYFYTSDGFLYCVPRKFLRESEDLRWARNIYKVKLVTFAVLCAWCAMAALDVLFLVLAIVYRLRGGM